jgi:hypothetical protein
MEIILEYRERDILGRDAFLTDPLGCVRMLLASLAASSSNVRTTRYWVLTVDVVIRRLAYQDLRVWI